MANLVPKLVRLAIKEFDINRKLLCAFSELRLLREDGGTIAFALVEDISAGWYYDFDTYHTTGVVFLATTEEDFYLRLENEITHVALDEIVYRIEREDSRSIKIEPPSGEAPYYKIPIRRTGHTYA